MANHEINEEQEAVNKALRMIETSDPVHADVYNALFSVLINNDVFLEKLANKMVQQVMISHVMDSTNKDMVMGADQGPVITQLIEKVQEKVDVLNTNAKKGVINKEHITTLSSPAQLTHAGFYSFAACSADVNSQVDEDSMKFTSYATGDFYAFLLGDQMTASGCRFGTLIITSPRFAGTFWIARIWERKFAGWFELCTK